MLELLMLILSTDGQFNPEDYNLKPQAVEFVREREEDEIEDRRIELMYKMESPLATAEEIELLQKELDELK